MRIPEKIEGEPVTSIGRVSRSSVYGAFSGSGIMEIYIPNTMTIIGEGAFSNCTGLTSINLPENLTSIENKAFWGCTGLMNITIPNGVTKIGGWAFNSCTGLTSITIPESVTRIGDLAFENCESLTNVTYKGITYSYNNDIRIRDFSQEFYDAVNGK